MKKSTIALAVASALAIPAAAQAETTLYGSARVSIDYVDQDGFDAIRGDDDDDFKDILDDLGELDGQWDVYNNSSRLGVRGSEDLGGGLSAIYQYEFGVDMTEGNNWNSNRPKLVGLQGGFGRISLGTQWTPYYNVLGVNDVFNSSRTFDTNYLGTFRRDNTVIYKTPDWGGFSSEWMIRSNADEGRDTIDDWQGNIKYENGPFLIGGAYIKDKGGCVQGFGSGSDCFDASGTNVKKPELFNERWGAAIAWTGTSLGASLIYEYQDFNGSLPVHGGVDEIDSRWNLNGVLEWSFGNNILRGSYAYIDNDDADETQEWVVGYQYNFSKRSRLWVEYIGSKDALIDDTAAGQQFVGTSDRDIVSIGMRHDF